MDYLTVYRPIEDKKRVGRSFDGGYIMVMLDGDYDLFISGGIADDLSFELELLTMYPDLHCVAYDGTIRSVPLKPVNYLDDEDQWIYVKDHDYIQIGDLHHNLGLSYIKSMGQPKWSKLKSTYVGLIIDNQFVLEKCPYPMTFSEILDTYDSIATSAEVYMWIYQQPNLSFIKKNLGSKPDENTENLNKYLIDHSDIFLKLDIEGWEYNLFESFTDADLLKIKQLVIEFHDPRNIKILQRLQKTHYLVHFHGNNCCGSTTVDGIVIPNVFECTYIRKSDQPHDLELNSDPIPSSLDQPNIQNMPEIELNHPPFVNNLLD